jgi:D-tyrosyl-tRNA(Tyr) deacylase
MRVVLQRVSLASVRIDGIICGEIEGGMLVLLGVGADDNVDDAAWLAKKIAGLRIFSDEAGLMNKSLDEVSGSLLVVSQFTLLADYQKGNRPSYIRAARPEQAVPLYEYFLEQLSVLTGKVPQTGKFGANMQVALVNDGPVTIVMDSKTRS